MRTRRACYEARYDTSLAGSESGPTKRTSLLSLPVELLQQITGYLKDLETLISWAQTCWLTRSVCNTPFGESVFLKLLGRVVVYADAARLAARIQYLDVLDGWIRPEKARWTFNGEEINEDWYGQVLSRPARFVYSAYLDGPKSQLWVPWLFEYRVMQANHKLMLTMISSWYNPPKIPLKDRHFAAGYPFETKENLPEIYGRAFYLMRTWDILLGGDEYEPRGKSWGTLYSGSSAERLQRPGFLDYICQKHGPVVLCELLAMHHDLQPLLKHFGSHRSMEWKGDHLPDFSKLRRARDKAMMSGKSLLHRTIFYIGYNNEATLVQVNDALDGKIVWRGSERIDPVSLSAGMIPLLCFQKEKKPAIKTSRIRTRYIEAD